MGVECGPQIHTKETVMRNVGPFATAALFLFMGGLSSAHDRNDLASVSVPADPHELATGRITIPATPKEISAAVALVDLARRNMGIYENTTLAFATNVSFSASGLVSYTGPGSMEEVRIARGMERWSATLANYSILRIIQDREAYDERTPGPIPLRIQMLRAALFWPFSNVLPRDRIRTRPLYGMAAPLLAF